MVSVVVAAAVPAWPDIPNVAVAFVAAAGWVVHNSHPWVDNLNMHFVVVVVHYVVPAWVGELAGIVVAVAAVCGLDQGVASSDTDLVAAVVVGLEFVFEVVVGCDMLQDSEAVAGCMVGCDSVVEEDIGRRLWVAYLVLSQVVRCTNTISGSAGVVAGVVVHRLAQVVMQFQNSSSQHRYRRWRVQKREVLKRNSDMAASMEQMEQRSCPYCHKAAYVPRTDMSCSSSPRAYGHSNERLWTTSHEDRVGPHSWTSIHQAFLLASVATFRCSRIVLESEVHEGSCRAVDAEVCRQEWRRD